MDKIRIIGVPEHFNFPWIKIVEEQPLEKEGILLEWKDEPKGSGAMNKAIREDQADIAIVLTESFVKDRLEGNPGKIIGVHVQSPLIWGIHVSSKFPTQTIDELQIAPFAISRYGSGSHLMAFLLADYAHWDLSRLEFEVVGDIEGAKAALESPKPKFFLWEKFMTQPLVDEGLFKRVGEIPTPWPCFVIVASNRALVKFPQALKRIRDLVYAKSASLREKKDLPQLLSKKYGIKESDIQAWLSQTEWARDSSVAADMLKSTMETLKTLELSNKVVPEEELVDIDFVKLT
ncbi:MAG TPA: hypothetical protein VKX33_10155 [Cyclobacteriaceae bacterium]|nr:hypothetical protein [Cyclobacteriaceae bacterium]